MLLTDVPDAARDVKMTVDDARNNFFDFEKKYAIVSSVKQALKLIELLSEVGYPRAILSVKEEKLDLIAEELEAQGFSTFEIDVDDLAEVEDVILDYSKGVLPLAVEWVDETEEGGDTKNNMLN